MNRWLYSVFLLFTCSMLIAQPGIEWSRNVSSNRSVIPNHIIPGPDQGYYVAGRLGANGWAARLDGNFNILWENGEVGGSGLDAFQGGNDQLLMTTEGDLLVAGGATSSDGLLPGNYGEQDAWIVKFSKNGDILWSRNYGSSLYDVCTGLLNAPNGGFYALFNSYGNDADFPEQRRVADLWVAKMSADGEILWKKPYGGTQREYGFSWVGLPDGQIVIAARAESIDMDLAGTDGTPALWLLKINGQGDIQWSRTYAGMIDQFHLSSTRDGGFIVCGKAFRESVYFSNHGKDDAFIMRFDNDGKMLWANHYGGSAGDHFNRITPLKDGSFVCVGSSFSDDGDLDAHYGKGDAWILRTNGKGEVIWSRTIGGTNGDVGTSLLETGDSLYSLFMYNGSFDGDFSSTSITPGPTIVRLDEALSTANRFNVLNVRLDTDVVTRGKPFGVNLPSDEPFLFRLYDPKGRLRFEQQLTGPKALIPTTRIEKGVHIYEISQGERINSGKVIIY